MLVEGERHNQNSEFILHRLWDIYDDMADVSCSGNSHFASARTWGKSFNALCIFKLFTAKTCRLNFRFQKKNAAFNKCNMNIARCAFPVRISLKAFLIPMKGFFRTTI